MGITHYTSELRAVLRQKNRTGADIFALIKRYKKYKKGKRKDELRDEILTINSKLVAGLAQKYSTHSKASAEDLFQSGMMGLIRALDKFSYRKGFKFSTYATFWIKRFMQQEHVAYNVISVSAYNRQNVSNLMKADGGLIDFSDMDAKKMKALATISALNSDAFIYLDKPIDINAPSFANAPSGDLADPIDYEKKIFSEIEAGNLHKVLDKVLNDRERLVISRRYLGSKPVVYSEIAKEIGRKSAEIVRLTENAALRKLKKYFKEQKEKEEAEKLRKQESVVEKVSGRGKVIPIIIDKNQALDMKLKQAKEKLNPGRILGIGTKCKSCAGSGHMMEIDLDGTVLETTCLECNGWGGRVMYIEKPFGEKK